MTRQLFRWIALVAALFGTLVMAAPASAAIYRFPAGTLSPQFKDGTCVYRIWYGNFGSTPFAKVRLYGGDCREITVRVAGARGSAISWYAAPTGYSGGVDSCGTYLEKQATAGGGPAVAVAMYARFPATSNYYYFWHDHGDPVRPYRYC